MSRAAGLCLLAAAMSLGPGGCRTVEGLTTRPAVRSVAVTVTHADLRAIHLRFDVDLLNPGDGEMRVKGYDYELQIEGRPFAAGASQEGFVLAPRGTARAAVPVVLALAELQRAMAAFKRQGEAAYRLAVTLLINTPLGDIRFPLTKEGCLRAFPPAVRSCPGRS